MAVIRATFTTIGQSSPASVSDDARGGGYKYRGDPNWTPGAYREQEQGEPLPQNVKATAGKRQRMAEYTRLRLEGKTKEEAGTVIGVSSSTASYYERDFQDQQRGEGTA